MSIAGEEVPMNDVAYDLSDMLYNNGQVKKIISNIQHIKYISNLRKTTFNT